MATVKYVVAYGCRINGTAYKRLELVDLDDTDPAVIDAVDRGRIRDYDDVVTGIGTGDIADGAITNDKVNATAGIVASKLSGVLASANNLSDVANAATARTNLGLGSAATLAPPYRALVAFSEIPSAASGTQDLAAAAGYHGGQTYQGNEQNNYQEWTVWLAAGTYTLRVIYVSSNSRGIATIRVNGTPLATTIDMYSSGSNLNNITDITNVTCAAGLNTIRFTGANKNASSSAYIISLQAFSLARTGA